MTDALPLLTVLTEDTPCRRCGYNLRGLSRDSRCPECHSPIALSIHRDLLRFADPQWLNRLTRGCWWILWGIPALIVSGGAGLALSAFGFNLPALFIVFLGSLVGVYGAWLLTAPDPGKLVAERWWSSRRIVRVGIIVGLSEAPLDMIAEGIALSPLLDSCVFGMSMLAMGVAIVAEVAKLVYLARLAMRIPDPVQAQRARVLAWLVGLGFLGITLGGGVAGIGAAMAPPPPVASANGTSEDGEEDEEATEEEDESLNLTYDELIILGGMVLALVFGVLLLVCAVCSLFLFYRLGLQFRAQAELALSTWDADPNAPPPTARLISYDESSSL